MCRLKPDADEIEAFLTQQQQEDWLRRSERRIWPQFVFHYTDIRNANSILRQGRLYSRLDPHNPFTVSAGSPAVLATTSQEYRDCVRFYFRPRTPTQFYAEGIHSTQSLTRSRFPDAHCPVPVFFLFDAGRILGRADCHFSDGGLGNPRARVLSTADDLRGLPWRKIYHAGPYDRSRAEDSDIAFRRNAEVIVGSSVDLSALRFVYCRSPAERETLLSLIGRELRQRFSKRVYASNRVELYDRKRTFVETARLQLDAVQFHFSPDTTAPGPFRSRVELVVGETQYLLEEANLELGPRRHVYRVSYPRPFAAYSIRLQLDEHLAYRNTYRETTLPF